jgi:hypothetical protein
VTDFGFATPTTQCSLCADAIFPTRVLLADWKRTTFLVGIRRTRSVAYRCVWHQCEMNEFLLLVFETLYLIFFYFMYLIILAVQMQIRENPLQPLKAPGYQVLAPLNSCQQTNSVQINTESVLLYLQKTALTELRNSLCGLVVRVSCYRSRGPGFDSRPYHIF